MDRNLRSTILYVGFASACALIAACGGSSTSTPSTTAPSGSPSTSPSSSPSTSPSASSSPAGVTWTFGGSTAAVTYTQGQVAAPASLAAYHGITVAATFVASIAGSGTIDYSDALNNGDVTPNTLPVDTATAGYTPIIYLSADNIGSQDISFGTAVPTIQLGDTSLGSYTTCNFDVYGSTGNNTYSWFSVPNAGTPNGSGVTVGGGALTGSNTVDFKAGSQQIIAVSCH